MSTFHSFRDITTTSKPTFKAYATVRELKKSFRLDYSIRELQFQATNISEDSSRSSNP